MARFKINALGIQTSMNDLCEGFADLDLEGPREDCRGRGTDPRTVFIAGSIANCRGKAELDEILAYMGRLAKEIEKARRSEHYERMKLMWNTCRENLSACVTEVR